MVLGKRCDAGAFWHVLTDQAVGVFAGTALPRVMRSGEEEADSCGTLELSVVVELGAVVSGDGFEALRVAAHEAQSALIGVLLRSRCNRPVQAVLT